MAKNDYYLDTKGLTYETVLAHARHTIAEGVKILQSEPAVMLYLGICEMVPVDDKDVTLRLSTVNAGGQIQLQYNPYWICRLNDASEMAFVMFGEAMRIALHHATHRRTLPATPHKLASDLICFENQSILSKWRPEVKEILKNLPTYGQIAPLIEPLGFDKDTMWQLEKIRKYLLKVQQQLGQCRCKSKSGKSGNDTADALNEHFAADEKHTRKATQEWGENTLVQQEVRRVTKHLGANPELWGSLPGNVQEMIRRANTPKFNPTPIIKHWKQTIQSEEFYDTRAKANRRHGFERPGWRHKMKSSMVECVDASGSMSDADVAIGEAFVNLFVKHCETWFCYWDAACGPIEKVKKARRGDLQLDNLRGGTDPSCIIDRIEKERLSFGGILVFTDNGFVWPRPKTKYLNKIFIIGTENCDAPPSWCRHYLNIRDIKKWMKDQNF